MVISLVSCMVLRVVFLWMLFDMIYRLSLCGCDRFLWMWLIYIVLLFDVCVIGVG